MLALYGELWSRDRVVGALSDSPPTVQVGYPATFARSPFRLRRRTDAPAKQIQAFREPYAGILRCVSSALSSWFDGAPESPPVVSRRCVHTPNQNGRLSCIPRSHSYSTASPYRNVTDSPRGRVFGNRSASCFPQSPHRCKILVHPGNNGP